nr:carotenoid oxygenase family protein [Coxiella burnetii]
MNRKYSLGFSTLNNEVVISELPIEGALPEWLSGTLIRNGPAKFEAGNKKLRHWFDGFAMCISLRFRMGRSPMPINSWKAMLIDT